MSIFIPSSTSYNGNVDLTNYYTKGQTNNILSGYVEDGTTTQATLGKITSNSGSIVFLSSGTGSFEHILLSDVKSSDGSKTYTLPSVAGTLALTSNISDIDLNQPTGFSNNTDSKISFNASTREFTIEPVSTSFSYYCLGTKYTKSVPETISIPNTDGVHYFYYNGATLTTATTSWSIDSNVPISYVYWDTTLSNYWFLAEERHLATMSKSVHKYLHQTVGARYASGLTLTGTTTGDGTNNLDAQIAITGGNIYDEDIEIAITTPYNVNTPFSQNLSLPASLQILYLSGASGWKRQSANSYPVYYNTRINYNLYSGGSWSLTPATNNYYVAYWIVATNNRLNPIFSLAGQRQDPNINASQANNTISGLSFTSLPFAEFKVLYRLIFQTSDSYSNAVKGRLVNITDLRTTSSLQGTTYVSTDHSSLSGLTNENVHPASSISTDTTKFRSLLTTSEIDVESALVKIDDIGRSFTCGTGNFENIIASKTGSFNSIVCSLSGSFGGLYTTGNFKSTNNSECITCLNGSARIKSVQTTDGFSVMGTDGNVYLQPNGSGGKITCEDANTFNPSELTINASKVIVNGGNFEVSKTGLFNSVICSQSGTFGGIRTSGNIVSIDSTDAGSTTTGAIRTAGGMACVKSLWVGGGAMVNSITTAGILYANNTEDSTATSNGSIRCAGGIGITKNIFCAQTGTFSQLSVSDVIVPSRIATSNSFTANFSGMVARNTSGKDWDYRNMCYSPELNIFITVCPSPNKVVASTDGGLTWAARSPSGRNFYDCMWCAELGLFVVSAGPATTSNIWTSPDSTNWTAQTTPSGVFQRCVYSTELGLLVCVANSGSTGARVITSPDAITWTAQTTPADNGWVGLAYDPERTLFVACATGGTNRIMYSTNATSWTGVSYDSGAWQSIAYSPTLKLFCVISATNFSTSPDGITWTTQSMINNNWYNIIWCDQLNMFIVVGSGGYIFRSSDGVNWTNAAITGNTNRCVCYAKELGTLLVGCEDGTANRIWSYYNPMIQNNTSIICCGTGDAGPRNRNSGSINTWGGLFVNKRIVGNSGMYLAGSGSVAGLVCRATGSFSQLTTDRIKFTETATGTSPLSYYQEYTLSTTTTECVAYTSFNVIVRRIGKIVVITVPEKTGNNSTVNDTYITFDSALPSYLCPAETVYGSCEVVQNFVQKRGYFGIFSGAISVYQADGLSWTSGQNGGFLSFSITYALP